MSEIECRIMSTKDDGLGSAITVMDVVDCNKVLWGLFVRILPIIVWYHMKFPMVCVAWPLLWHLHWWTGFTSTIGVHSIHRKTSTMVWCWPE